MTACGDLQDRITRLDRMIGEPEAREANPNPLAAQLARLRHAFEA